MGIFLKFYLTLTQARNQDFLGQGRFYQKRAQFLYVREKSHRIILTSQVVIYRTTFLAIFVFSIG